MCHEVTVWHHHSLIRSKEDETGHRASMRVAENGDRRRTSLDDIVYGHAFIPVPTGRLHVYQNRFTGIQSHEDIYVHDELSHHGKFYAWFRHSKVCGIVRTACHGVTADKIDLIGVKIDSVVLNVFQVIGIFQINIEFPVDAVLLHVSRQAPLMMLQRVRFPLS